MVNEFDFEILRDGYNQSKTTQNEVDQLNRGKDWHLLFPETVQDVTTVESSSNKHPLCHQEGFNQEHATLPDIGLGKKLTSNFAVPSESDQIHLTFQDESSSFAKVEEPENSSVNHSTLLDTKSICVFTLGNTPASMHNPPAQVMERDEVHDPQRIPASVFARRESVIPAEWSISSSESLFSLQVGSSMSREQTLLLSGELERLAQLSKSGELSNVELKELRKLAGLSKSPCPPPPDSPKVEVKGEIPEANNLEGQKEKIVLGKKEGTHQHQPSSIHSSNVSRPSDVSEDSTYSFAFPVLRQGEKSAANSGRSRQSQSEADLEAKSSLAASEPVAPRKRRHFRCFSCSHCVSCNRLFSCSRLFCCSRCSCCKSCFSCSNCFSRNCCCMPCFPKCC